eukprot:gene7337-13068_t
MDLGEDNATVSELKLFLKSILETFSNTADKFVCGDITRLEILEKALSDQTGVVIAMEAVVAEAIVDSVGSIPSSYNVETNRQLHT